MKSCAENFYYITMFLLSNGRKSTSGWYDSLKAASCHCLAKNKERVYLKQMFLFSSYFFLSNNNIFYLSQRTTFFFFFNDLITSLGTTEKEETRKSALFVKGGGASLRRPLR